MAITKNKKQKIIKELGEKIDKAKSVVFANYQGVSANDINDLRTKFKEADSEYVVAKKSLMGLAFGKSQMKGVKTKEMEGEVAVVFGYVDEVAPAKLIDEFSKDHKSMQMVGGVIENKFIDADRVKELAKLPSKIELYAKVVGSIKAPVSGFVNVLGGNLRNLVYVLNAIQEKK